ncbi:MAG: hypothetical protein L0271_16345 [Gemmatimonadetes bacterium]|nr:hypothetical protein [Gemmatimonadota bacterium]
MHAENLWIAMLTRNVQDAGTSDRPRFFVNGPGGPFRFGDLPVPDEHLGRGQGGLARIPIGDLGFLPEELEYSVSAGSSDAWSVQHMSAWAERAESGAIVPLGFGAAPVLSQDADEGEASFTPPAVRSGNVNTPIFRLLIAVHTGPFLGLPIPGGAIRESGTASPVNLQIGTASGIVVDFDFPDTSQSDRGTFRANYYIAPVPATFTRSQLTDDSIVLSIRGTDRWAPVVFVVFGIDTIRLSGARALVPLVHLAPWPFGSMSTDPTEGIDSVHLPLTPIDDPLGRPGAPDFDVIALRRLQRRVLELERKLSERDGEVGG